MNRYAEPSGLVSYEIRSTVGGVPSSYSFVGLTSAATKSAKVAARTSGREPNVENVSFPATGISLVPIPDISGRADAESIPDSGLREVDRSTEVPKACNSTLVTNYGPQWVRVGEAYGVTGGKVKFTYTSGATSSLGVGVSISGNNGTFSLSGSSTGASTVTQSYADRTSGAYYNTKFNYGKYLATCVADTSVSTYYTAKFTSYAGGTSVSVPGAAPTANFCINHANGDTTIDYSSAYEFATGVSIASTIGVNLSSKTGFNTKTSLKFTWTAPRKLCGSADYEGGSPKRLVAKT